MRAEASIKADRTGNVAPGLLAAIDLARLQVSEGLNSRERDHLGQFLTPMAVALQMASMFDAPGEEVRILDPGAGIGSLGAALVLHLLNEPQAPKAIGLVFYEIDDSLLALLGKTAKALDDACRSAGVSLTVEIRNDDFLLSGVDQIAGGLFAKARESFDAIIMNPPYRKISAHSVERTLCRRLGLETTNLYSAFLAVAAELLRPEGQLVAIVPRSFANGTYFQPFRKWFLDRMTFNRLHLYESRKSAFSDDDVLQENVIFQAVKSAFKGQVTITSSTDHADLDPTYRIVEYQDVVRRGDPAQVIHIVPDETSHRIAERMALLPATLADIGLAVSTGRVVDFRATEYLRASIGPGAAPLIYPGHLRRGRVDWPMESGRKPNALLNAPGSMDLLVPEGLYVLTKRFSSKEERRRIVAALYDPADVVPGQVAFENHLNYFHVDGLGLDRPLAVGLRAYLNSSLTDLYFRQFSGHTQVNAGDLRRLRYPSQEQLRRLGERLGDIEPDQRELDAIIDEELFALAEDTGADPVRVRQRIDEAIAALRMLGLPRAQLNERSGLTLLALLDLGPNDPWSQASNPLKGVTPMMDTFRERYGKTYAPNTRETVRRQTVHQFLDAGLVLINPDQPERPTNSPKAVYQIEPSALELLRSFGQDEWQASLGTYLASRETLRQEYAAERQMARIPVTLQDGRSFTLSGGGQNVLIAEIIKEFCPRWTPGGVVLYVGDADDKFVFIDTVTLKNLSIDIEEHGKMPDLVIQDVDHGWLVLIEAVTSHGPVDGKRRGELTALFGPSTVPLVYITAFLDRHAMAKYLPQIAWETEVWCASDPTHLIHFNGERFWGPYDQATKLAKG